MFIAAGLCGVLTLVRFAASFFPSERLWGLSFWGYFPLHVRIGATLLALAILIPWVNRSLRSFLTVLSEWIKRYLLQIPWKLGYLVLGVGAGFIFFLLRERTYYLGDGRSLLSFLARNHLPPGSSEPLGRRIPWALHWILSPWHPAPETNYIILSCTAGVLFLLFARLWAKTSAGGDRPGRWLAFGVLLTMGVVQQFCGYVENYSFLPVGQLAYFLFGIWALKGRCSLLYPTLILGILIMLHLANLMLAPTWVLLWVERRKGWSEGRKTWGIALGILGTLLLTFLAILKLGRHQGFSRFILPLWGGLVDAPGYFLFSWDHGVDIINLHLLASPVMLPLLFLTLCFVRYLKVERNILRYLLLGALAEVAFTVLFNPELGAGRDWDVLTACGTIAYTLLFTYAVVKSPLANPGYLALALFWTGLFSTAGFVALNASKAASFRRAMDIAVMDPLRDRGYRERSLTYFFHEKYFSPLRVSFEQRALTRIETILTKYPKNPVAHYLRGDLLWSLKSDTAGARKEFQIALEEGPEHFYVWEALAEIYLAQGRLQDAISCYERHVAWSPMFCSSWSRLAQLYGMTGQTDQEIRCLEKLTQLSPNEADFWEGLGFALLTKKEYSGAESAFRRAIRLNPQDAMVHLNLSVALQGLGKKEEAQGEYGVYEKLATLKEEKSW